MIQKQTKKFINTEQMEEKEENQFLQPKQQFPKKPQLTENDFTQIQQQVYKYSDKFDFLDQYIKKTLSQNTMTKSLSIFSLLVLVTLTLFLFFQHNGYLKLQISRVIKIITSSKEPYSQQTAFIQQHICPYQYGLFHVQFKKTQKQKLQLPKQVDQRYAFCKIPFLNQRTLARHIQRWNQKFPQSKIYSNKFKDLQERKIFLILLQLYFHSGAFVDHSIPYYNISNRCLQNSFIGFETMFGGVKYQNQKGFFIPDTERFIKARFPFSPEIKGMIEKLIRKQDFLEHCNSKQCLIVKCFN